MGFFNWLFGTKTETPSRVESHTERDEQRPIVILLENQLTVPWDIQTEAIDQPVAGLENAVPFPKPPPAGAQTLTFRGSGNATTGTFTLEGDAVLRIAAEAMPFKLWIKRNDGSHLPGPVELAQPGTGSLTPIPEGGVYSLVIQTPARWGITVVFR